MRFSTRAKLVALVAASFSFLSLWKSLWGQASVQAMTGESLKWTMEHESRPETAEAAVGRFPKGMFDKTDISTRREETHGLNTARKAAGDANTLTKGRNPSDQKESLVGGTTQSPSIVKRPATAALVAGRQGQGRTILVSYMRSGSTFTGDLFQSSPDVMYFYEPLLYTNDVDELAKGTPIRQRLIYKFRTEPHPPDTLSYTRTMMHCNLTAWNLKYLIGQRFSRSFDDYATCVKKWTGNPAPGDNCTQEVTGRCRKSQSVISKILRLKMWEVDDLLTSDPELSIIHLVRDPRGITQSRNVAGYYVNPRTLCRRINKDAVLSIELQKKFPGRILTVRYEDLALSPLQVTEKLFNHARIDWTQDVANKVGDLTAPSNNSFSEQIFGTKRKNSSTTAFNWRQKLSFPTAQNIQSYCQEMMRLYGYVSFKSSQEQKDLRHPSTTQDYSSHFYKAQHLPVSSSV